MPSAEEFGHELIRSITVEDRTYELFSRHCDVCGDVHLEIWRWSGTSFAAYHLNTSETPECFEDFIKFLDDQLLMESPDHLKPFLRRLSNASNHAGICADGSYEFRLLEYGRRRLSTLKALGQFENLMTHGTPDDANLMAVKAAFELGVAVAEHKYMYQFEDYLRDGMAMNDWRMQGLPKAREERLRQGRRTRKAIEAALARVLEANPELVRNDTEAARQILRLNIAELDKGNGTQISLEAITKHIRAIRLDKCHRKNL